MAPDLQLRWRHNGPGIGRDARLAYSSLLGRYMARAYLTESEGVRILVPLDAAKRALADSPYVIHKDPPSRGLEADWIGFDDNQIVIAEAKGTFDEGKRPWRGPSSWPQVLQTAIGQAERTALFRSGHKLPAKRWAIASRWGTEENGCDPTLLAWDPDEPMLSGDEFAELARRLVSADLQGVMTGMRHPEAAQALDAPPPSGRLPGDLRLKVGDRVIEPGLLAAVGPFGSHPIRGEDDLTWIRGVRELAIQVAITSLSSRYVLKVRQDARWADDVEEVDERGGRQAGMTVVWPEPDEEISVFA